MYKRPFERAIGKFVAESNWVCECFAQANTHPRWQHSDLACEMMAIRLHDAWARFCRELIVISAYGKVVTVGGMRLDTSLPTIKSRNDVIPTLVTMNNGRFPKWYASDECVRAAGTLKIENISTVAAALGATNSPANKLRDVRNFCSHRGRFTAKTANVAGQFVGRSRPDIYQLNSFVAGGQTLLESWTTTLIAIANAAVQ
jgi:hypothetical protein